MNDAPTHLVIAVQEIRGVVERNRPPTLDETITAVFALARDHYLLRDEEECFRVACAVVGLVGGPEVKASVERELEDLRVLSAMLTPGVPVDLEEALRRQEDASRAPSLGLLKRWRDGR